MLKTIEQYESLTLAARQAVAAHFAQNRCQIEATRQALAAHVAQNRRQMEMTRQTLAAQAEQSRRQTEVTRQTLAAQAEQSRHQMEAMRQGRVNLEAHFRLPETTEIARLISEMSTGPFSEISTRYAEQMSSLQRAMEGIQTPWLGVLDATRSIAGLAELQGIGRALEGKSTFASDLASTLRTGLGDWRDPITWPPEIYTDLAARSDFYSGLGFDRGLTDFPAPAFEQSLRIAGFRQEPPPLVDLYGPPVPRSVDNGEEESLARTNMAHDWLLRLETQLRRFIDEQMTRAFGPDWPRHRLPKDLYEKWQEKKSAAEGNNGREWPLIAYADFTDYALVICKRDNWRQVFAPFFNREESVRESFQRLCPIRLDTMHARPITQDDELLLYVETKRLAKIIIIV